MAEKRAATCKQRAFVEHYLLYGNAAEAARRAGYYKTSGSRVLHSDAVQRLLWEARAKKEAHASRRLASAEEVLEYLTGVLRGEADDDGRQGASAPRMKAAELLGKRLGIFSENPEPQPPPVIIDDIGPPREDDG